MHNPRDEPDPSADTSLDPYSGLGDEVARDSVRTYADGDRFPDDNAVSIHSERRFHEKDLITVVSSVPTNGKGSKGSTRLPIRRVLAGMSCVLVLVMLFRLTPIRGGKGPTVQKPDTRGQGTLPDPGTTPPPPPGPSAPPEQVVVDLKSVKYALLKVKEAKFRMGSDQSPEEGPAHSVEIRSFYLGATEVSWELIEAYWEDRPEERPRAVTPDANKKLPAHSLSYPEWAQFMNWLGSRAEPAREPYYDKSGNPPPVGDPRRFGNGFRLPTEAELEYLLLQSADPKDSLPGLVPVGEAPLESRFRGLRGNLWELTGDSFVPYDKTRPQVDPLFYQATRENVIRGGAAGLLAEFGRAKKRSAASRIILPSVGARVATYGDSTKPRGTTIK